MYSFVGLISSAQLSKGCMVSGKKMTFGGKCSFSSL